VKEMKVIVHKPTVTNEVMIEQIENVTSIIALKDGRHIVHSIDQCKCCGQNIEKAIQVPSGYKMEVYND
jgi:predicted Zn-ribbon and HTH transcriptional regulator